MHISISLVTGATLPAPVQPGLPLPAESAGGRGHGGWVAPSEQRGRVTTEAAVDVAAADDVSLKQSFFVPPLPPAVAAVALAPHEASESAASGALLLKRKREIEGCMDEGMEKVEKRQCRNERVHRFSCMNLYVLQKPKFVRMFYTYMQSWSHFTLSLI